MNSEGGQDDANKSEDQEILEESTHLWLKNEIEATASISKGFRNQTWGKRSGTYVFRPIPSKEHKLAYELIKQCNEMRITDLFFLESIDFGGVNRVARNLAESIRRLDSQKRIAFIVTGGPAQSQNHFTSPLDAPIFFLNSLDSVLTTSDIERVIYILCTSLRSLERQYCFNSEGHASVLSKHAELLAIKSKVFFALFCEDKNSWKRDISFGARYYSKLYQRVHGFISDNSYYSSRLGKSVGHLDARADWITLHQPTRGKKAEPIPDNREGPLIWAGRFSSQKNWKLLIRIARAMPDQKFLAFGSGSEKAINKMMTSTKNLEVMNVYKNAAEVLAYKPQCLVYTSKWDGIPNVLIEFGWLGIPIVTSTAGSILELVGQAGDRAILVEKYWSKRSFVTKLRELLQNPEQARLRALRMQRHLSSAHSELQFDKTVKSKILNEAREQKSTNE